MAVFFNRSGLSWLRFLNDSKTAKNQNAYGKILSISQHENLIQGLMDKSMKKTLTWAKNNALT